MNIHSCWPKEIFCYKKQCNVLTNTWTICALQERNTELYLLIINSHSKNERIWQMFSLRTLNFAYPVNKLKNLMLSVPHIIYNCDAIQWSYHVLTHVWFCSVGTLLDIVQVIVMMIFETIYYALNGIKFYPTTNRSWRPRGWAAV